METFFHAMLSPKGSNLIVDVYRLSARKASLNPH